MRALLVAHGPVRAASPYGFLLAQDATDATHPPIDNELARAIPVLARPVRLVIVAAQTLAGRAEAIRVSDGEVLVTVGFTPEGACLVGRPQPVGEFVRALAAEIGSEDPLRARQAEFDPGIVAALWALAAEGVGPGVAIEPDHALRALGALSRREEVAREVLEGLLTSSVLERDGAMLRLGPTIAGWPELLRIGERIELTVVSADDLEDETGDVSAIQVVFIGRGGARLLVHRPPSDPARGMLVTRLADGDLEALLWRAAGLPDGSTLARALEPSMRRWHADLRSLNALLDAGAGLEGLDAGDALDDEGLDPAVEITAHVTGPEGSRSRTWRVWPNLATEGSAAPASEDDDPGAVDDDLRPRLAFLPDDLLLRVVAFCAFGDAAAPSSFEPADEPERGGLLQCSYVDGARLEGGTITWVVDQSGGCWLLDSDDAETDEMGRPLPTGVDGNDLARLFVSYLPGGVSS